MKKSLKTWLQGLVVAGTLVLVAYPGRAHAAQSWCQGTVKEVLAYGTSGEIWLKHNGTASGSNWLKISTPSDAQKARMLSLLVSALLAGRQVNIEVNYTGSVVACSSVPVGSPPTTEVSYVNLQ